MRVDIDLLLLAGLVLGVFVGGWTWGYWFGRNVVSQHEFRQLAGRVADIEHRMDRADTIS